MTAVAQLTQLRALHLGSDEGTEFSVGCLAALTGLHFLSLFNMDVAGLPLVAQACSSSTQLKFKVLHLRPPTLPFPLQPPCSWPSLVELVLKEVSPGFVSHALPTPQAAPLLTHLSMPKDVLASGLWPRELQYASFFITSIGVGQQQEFELLAADLQFLVACPRGEHINLPVYHM